MPPFHNTAFMPSLLPFPHVSTSTQPIPTQFKTLKIPTHTSVPTPKRTRLPAHIKTHMNASENTHPSKQTVRIAILVSGGGRSLQNILDLITNGRLTGCNVCLVIASNKSAAALQRAAVSDVPTRVVRLRDYEGSDEFSEGVSKVLDAFEVDLVVMAGWMHFYRIPTRYDGKVINIHPSLIPAFCGKGYYGHRVHQAVVKFGAKITGCTVHLADNKYDHGPIIVQKAVPVLDDDTADDLASRVFEAEKEALPEAIQLFVDNRISVEQGVVRIEKSLQSSGV